MMREFLLNLFFPLSAVCPLCDRKCEENGLCIGCMKKLEENAICAHRLQELPEGLDDVLYACRHEGAARLLVHELKYKANGEAAELLGQQMVKVYTERGFLPAPDFVTCVPSSPKRLRMRGYNQAELLARFVSRETGMPLQTEALRRKKHLSSLVTMTAEERRSVMQGVFEADGRIAEGKTILLIDDVMTTGATASVCAQALKAAGAKKVYLLTACHA